MKTWFAAQELAGLPGLPGTEQGVRYRATLGEWLSRKREQGKGHEYHLDSLPIETRDYLIKKNPPPRLQNALIAADIAGTLERAANAQRKEQSLIKYQSMSMTAKTRADTKLEILRTVDETAKTIGWQAAAIRLIYEYADYPEWTAVIPELSFSTLYRWRKVMRDDGIAALAGRYAPHKPNLLSTEIDIYNVFLSTIHQHPTASAVHILDMMLASLDPATPRPSLRTVQRWWADWRRDNSGVYAHMVNPDQARGRIRPAMGDMSEDVIRLLQRWELDSTPSDVMLQGQRYAVIGCIDVWSRRAKLLVAKTSKSDAIALLLRRCIIDWGVPEEAKTDNGQDYISKYLGRVLAALEIEHIRCLPKSPWLKPHIERFFRTYAHGIAELLPGYIGHNVSEQQARRSRTFSDRFMSRGQTVELTLDPAQFAEFCDTWADGIYAQRRHSTLGCTPAEKWMSYNGEIKRIANDRSLDLLLAPSPDGEFRTVKKTGITIAGHDYIAPEFGDPNLIGQRVRPLLDVDLGRVVVLDGDFRFICNAECPDLLDMDRRKVALAAQRLQKDRLATARQAMRDAAKKVRLVDAIEEHLRIAAEKAKVIPLHPPVIEHMTPALIAAIDAIDARQPSVPEVLTAEEQRTVAARLRVIDAPDDEEPWQQYRRLFAALPDISAQDRDWMTQFEATPEGHALHSVLTAPAEEWDVLAQ